MPEALASKINLFLVMPFRTLTTSPNLLRMGSAPRKALSWSNVSNSSSQPLSTSLRTWHQASGSDSTEAYDTKSFGSECNASGGIPSTGVRGKIPQSSGCLSKPAGTPDDRSQSATAQSGSCETERHPARRCALISVLKWPLLTCLSRP